MTRSDLYSKLQEGSREFKERNDCAVVAVAAVLDIEYKQAHAILKQLGRKDGKGTYRAMTKEAIGWFATLVKVDVNSIINKYPGCHRNLKSITTHHMARFNDVWKDGKTYIAFTRHHVLAIKDGRNHDWTEGRSKQIRDIYEVVKKEN